MPNTAGNRRQQCGRSSAGRAPPCQGGCREFESRRPLAGHCHGKGSSESCLHGGLAERRGSGLQSRIHGFESRTHLGENLGIRLNPENIWAIGAAVARFPDTEEVTGSIPVSPTRARQLACCRTAGATGPCFMCGRSSAGRAPPCQGGCREFESRRPLSFL